MLPFILYICARYLQVRTCSNKVIIFNVIIHRLHGMHMNVTVVAANSLAILSLTVIFDSEHFYKPYGENFKNQLNQSAKNKNNGSVQCCDADEMRGSSKSNGGFAKKEGQHPENPSGGGDKDGYGSDEGSMNGVGSSGGAGDGRGGGDKRDQNQNKADIDEDNVDEEENDETAAPTQGAVGPDPDGPGPDGPGHDHNSPVPTDQNPPTDNHSTGLLNRTSIQPYNPHLNASHLHAMLDPMYPRLLYGGLFQYFWTGSRTTAYLPLSEWSWSVVDRLAFCLHTVYLRMLVPTFPDPLPNCQNCDIIISLLQHSAYCTSANMTTCLCCFYLLVIIRAHLQTCIPRSAEQTNCSIRFCCLITEAQRHGYVDHIYDYPWLRPLFRLDLAVMSRVAGMRHSNVVYGGVTDLMRFCLILHYRRVRTNQGVILSDLGFESRVGYMRGVDWSMVGRNTGYDRLHRIYFSVRQITIEAFNVFDCVDWDNTDQVYAVIHEDGIVYVLTLMQDGLVPTTVNIDPDPDPDQHLVTEAECLVPLTVETCADNNSDDNSASGGGGVDDTGGGADEDVGGDDSGEDRGDGRDDGGGDDHEMQL